MSEISYTFDNSGDYTFDSDVLRVYNSFCSIRGHQDSSVSPVLTTNNGADDGGAGEFDQCLDFVAANTDYIQVTDATYIPAKLVIGASDSFTMEMWFKRNGHPSAIELPIDFRRLGLGRDIIAFETQTDGTMRCMIRSTTAVGGNISIYGGTDVCDNTWHHIAFVRDVGNDELRLYIDGSSDATPVTDATTGALTSTATTLFRIGAYNGNNFYHNGQLDEIRISNSIRYTSNFTPSTSEFVADANTMYLNHMEGASAHATTDPAIYKATGDNINVASWTSFTEDATKYGANAEVKYQLYNGTAYQYWNGSAWANSDGTYAQSSTASDINTNIGSFTTGSITGFNIKVLLHADASDTPILDSITASYVESLTGGLINKFNRRTTLPNFNF